MRGQKQLLPSKCLQRAVLLLLFLSSALAEGGTPDFLGRLPEEWTLISTHEQSLIFKNTQSKNNEMLVLQVLEIDEDPAFMEKDAGAKKRVVEEVRQNFMGRLGFTSFKVLSFAEMPAPHEEVQAYQMTASFLDLSARKVQLTERQYIHGRKLYVLTHMMDSAHSVAHRGQKMLESFRPNFEKARQPTSASELAKPVGEIIKGKKGEEGAGVLVLPPHQLRNYPESTEKCEKVPAEKRRQPGEASVLDGLTSTAAMPFDCLTGILVDNLWEMLMGLAELGWAGLKYAFSSEYRTQVNATIGSLAAQIKKDPSGFAKKVGQEIVTAISTGITNFTDCYNFRSQVRAFCNVASNLIPQKLLLKLLSKTKMAIEDTAKIVNLARTALEGDGALRATTVRTAADGSRVHEFENGISVRVVDEGSASARALPAPGPRAAQAEVAGGNGAMKAEDGAAHAKRAKRPIEAISKEYETLLGWAAREEEVLATIGELEVQGVSKERIKKTLREYKPPTECGLR
ncbi:MAG: hypothetical protein C5B49_04355 [Bdellovibrio sp.]|nr:MAG: hypothetical protein C5B49_04355 [Bdellovibrio sp.]